MNNLKKDRAQWEKSTLGDVSENVMYGLNSKAIEFDGNKKYIRITDIDESTNQFKPAPLTSPNGISDKKYKLIEGDLLFARTGASVGKSYLYDNNDGNLYFAGFLIRFHIIKQNPKFIFLQTQTQSYWNWVKSISMRSGQPGINAEEYKKLPIVLPPLAEQNKIANFLQTWDTAIEKTEALIAAKQKQFEWLIICTLNTPDNTWKSSLLKDLTTINKGQQINRNTLQSKGDYPVWNGGIIPSGYTNKYNTEANIVTISEGGNSCGFVNYSDKKFWCGGHCYALNNSKNNINIKFLYYYLKSQEKRIMKLRVGSGLPNIQRQSIENLEIKYPNMQKQEQITGILNAAQDEIDRLNQLADVYRTQKHGLIQKLLSSNGDYK